MKTRLFALLVFLLLPVAAFAAQVKALPSPKDQQIWFAEDHTVPIVSLVASLPAGSVYDTKGKDGLAAFAAALMDEGAGNLDSRAFQTALSEKAIRFSAKAERDYVVITVTTLKENAGEAFRLLGLALKSPRFDADAIARVRSQMLQNLEQDKQDPEKVAGKAFDHAFYGDHPYGHDPDGDAAGINAITRADLTSFAKNHWVQGGMLLAAAGDIAPSQLQDLIGKTFGVLPAGTSGAISPPAHLGSPGIQNIPMNVPQPTVMFGLPGISRADKDFIPAYVANHILGSGDFTARLTVEVRVKRGLTYGIQTELDNDRQAAAMVGNVASRADAVRQTIDVVRATMKDFADKGPTAQELADAKTYLTGSFPLAFTSNMGTATQLGAYQRQGLDVGYVTRRNGLINAVTIDDVRRVAKRLYTADSLTIVVAGTLPPAGPAAPSTQATPQPKKP